MTDYSVMGYEDLDAARKSLLGQRQALHEELQGITKLMRKVEVKQEAEAALAKLSEPAKEALRQMVGPQGVESAEQVNGPQGQNFTMVNGS